MADNVTLPIADFNSCAAPNAPPTDKIGVAAALAYAKDSKANPAVATINQQFSLKDKVAIVTGGNTGIGLEYSVALAELGAHVVALDLAADASEDFTAAAKYIAALNIPGAGLEYGSADVTDAEKISAAIEAIATKHGHIDVCVANAGILGPIVDCHKYPADWFRKVIDVNVTGVFLTCQAAARTMIERKIKGSLIVTASISASIINKDMHWIPYTASKGAALQLSRGLAAELAPLGIRCNAISPGHMRTRLLEGFLQKEPLYENQWAAQNPMGRIGALFELRGAVAYLASDASTYTTGAEILVSGGHTVW